MPKAPPNRRIDSDRYSASPRRLTAGARTVSLEAAAELLGTALGPHVAAAARRLPLRFPEEYAALADPADPNDPVRRIGWPDLEEIAPDPGAIADPVGEDGLHPHPAIVRKYPDRALLLVTARCHFYCRFCFRAGHGAEPTLAELDDAIRLLAGDPRVREVILSGGDPLVLPDATLAAILRRLGSIPSLTAVRIHSRAPVHDPARITPELVRALVDAAPRPLRFVLHATHPRELRPAFGGAVRKLHAGGIRLLDQTVLLAGVNADPGILADLFLGLHERRVEPYYLHHPDRIAGTARFRVSIDEGLAIYRALRERLPAPALPAYVLDLPDGSGKVPVESLVRVGDRRWRAGISTYQEP